MSQPARTYASPDAAPYPMDGQESRKAPETTRDVKAPLLPRHQISGVGNIAGMNSSFVTKLENAFSKIVSGACRVGSGFRSHAEQAALYRAKPGLAAPPGHSNHERGLAADLSCSGGGLHWMHVHAFEFGLHFPMSYEAWHIEPIGATRYASHRHHTRYAARHRAHHRRYAHHYRHRHYARA